MIDLTSFLSEYLQKLDSTFGNRVWFVGLQGSYGRGEATETSDIDMGVILDELTVQDLQRYRSMLDTLPNRELVCGFLSGRQEILNWDPADLFQFYHDTIPIHGTLDALLPMMREGCAGQLPEIYDGDHPTEGKGCFGQAWSVGEMLRVFEAIEK